MDIEMMNNVKKYYGNVDWYLAAPNGELKVSRAQNRTFGLIIMTGIGSSKPEQTAIWNGISTNPVNPQIGTPKIFAPKPHPKFDFNNPYNY
jgi:hypothetical protein